MFIKLTMNLIPHIIIDNGSDFIKAGLSGEESPRSVFPNVIKKSNHHLQLFGDQIGNQAKVDKIRNFEYLSYPINFGLINNHYDMLKIWNYTFTKELKVNPLGL